MTEATKKDDGPAPRKPDFGNAPAEQQRSREAAAQQADADKREADAKRTKDTAGKAGDDKEKSPFKATKEQPDENPAASAQMTAQYGELERDFSDGVEKEPDPVSDKEREKQRDAAAKQRSTTVKKKEGS